MSNRNADDSELRQPKWKVILTHDGSRTLQLVGSDVTFHSTSGAATESLHVFVNNSGIFGHPDTIKPIRILEFGFGTGLNFLLTVDEAIRRKRSIEYVAIDQMLLSRSLFEELGFGGLVENREIVAKLADFPGDRSQDESVVRMNSSPKNQRHKLDLSSPTGGHISLHLLLQDFLQMELPAGPFDAIYFDPFAPEVDGQFWQADYLAKLFPLLRSGGTLVSYCVKSVVQRSLRNAGFAVRTVRGPAGGKREVLIATRP